MSGIFWLASYPKSGNTWMRAFLCNYLEDAEQPVDINALKYTALVSDRQIFDDLLGLDSGDLLADELDALRPAVYRTLARYSEKQQALFWKIHDAFQRLPNGAPMFPPDVTGGVIYMARSPLDLAISYAHHSAVEVDTAIEWMRQDDHGLFMLPVRLNQVHQRMYSWSDHVRSWIDQTELSLLRVRYEDMLLRPQATFSGVVDFVGAALADGAFTSANAARIAKALHFSSFDELKRQEAEKGFSEKDLRATSFFRSGKLGEWRERLTPEQVRRIVDDHGEMMRRLGYLDGDGEIVDFSLGGGSNS